MKGKVFGVGGFARNPLSWFQDRSLLDDKRCSDLTTNVSGQTAGVALVVFVEEMKNRSLSRLERKQSRDRHKRKME
jgi:hypothetical protein